MTVYTRRAGDGSWLVRWVDPNTPPRRKPTNDAASSRCMPCSQPADHSWRPMNLTQEVPPVFRCTCPRCGYVTLYASLAALPPSAR